MRYSKHIANFLSILSCWLHCVVVIMVILDILTIIHIFSIRLDLIINCRWVFCVLYLGVFSLYNLYRTALNWYYYDYSLHFANTWLLFFFSFFKIINVALKCGHLNQLFSKNAPKQAVFVFLGVGWGGGGQFNKTKKQWALSSAKESFFYMVLSNISVPKLKFQKPAENYKKIKSKILIAAKNFFVRLCIKKVPSGIQVLCPLERKWKLILLFLSLHCDY